MAGRRRTRAGLKAFADTLEPILKEKREREAKREDIRIERELKRKYAEQDFYKKLRQEGILIGVRKGTVNPLTLEEQTLTPKALSPGDQATQQKLDLVRRLQSTDPEERRQAIQQLREFQAGGFIPGSIDQTSVLDEYENRLPPTTPRGGLTQQTPGLIGKSGWISGGIYSPGQVPTRPPAIAPTQASLGVTNRVNQAQIDLALDDAMEAIRLGADSEEIKKALKRVLGY